MMIIWIAYSSIIFPFRNKIKITLCYNIMVCAYNNSRLSDNQKNASFKNISIK